MTNKLLLAIAAVLVLTSCSTVSKVNRSSKPWAYEVESMGVGVEGTYIIRVWSYYRNVQMPVEVAKKNAVHAVLFKGVPGGHGAASQGPIVSSEEAGASAEFFRTFFERGEYLRYINSVATGGKQVLKSGRREYKIGYVISVAKDNLRKDLEDQGVIRALSSGF